jgi:hypothetical protein
VLVAAPTSSPDFALRATLTSFGNPIGGETIVFRAGTRTLCTTVTSPMGVARCAVSAKAGQGAIANARGYNASFAGSTYYLPASATGTFRTGR